MYRKKKSGIIGIIITIIILVLVVIFSNGETNTSFFENAATNLVMPIQNGLTYLKNKLSGNGTFFTDINNLKEENEKLKQRNSELEQSLRELENIKTQNETLQEYLNLSEKYGEYNTIPSYVINKDISKENMTVIGDQGLVGHVISVTNGTAKVQTIIDTASSVSCTMSTTDESIVCKGTLDEDSTLRGMYIPTDANVVQGDSVETSGLGGIYPKGIHVGIVRSVENAQNITDRYATIDTAVDFDKLDTVLVIINQ